MRTNNQSDWSNGQCTTANRSFLSFFLVGSVMYHVYLAGPITGCDYGECVDWRQDWIDTMPKGIICLSPMRGKVYLKGAGEIQAKVEYTEFVLCRDNAIMARDFYDCNRANVIVFNLLGAKRVSIGTVMEIAWGYAKHTPMVFVMEKEGNLHDHAMIRACGGFRCESLEEAKLVVRAVLDVENVGH